MLTVAALATALGVSAWPPERELRDGPAGARCKSRRLLAHPRSADAGRLRERRLQLPPPFLGSLCSEERLGMTEPRVEAEVHVVRAVDDVLLRGRIRTQHLDPQPRRLLRGRGGAHCLTFLASRRSARL
jgi:hypothetical protein